jgi:site-specific recombinase XerD
MTRKSYREAVLLFAAFLDERGGPTLADDVTRADVEDFIGEQLARWTPATAAVRFRSLQSFWKWAHEALGLEHNPMSGMEPPRVPEKLVPLLTLDQQRRLVHACVGQTFDDARDEALVRLMLETGLRRAEAAGITLDRLDLAQRRVVVTGKGARERVVGFGLNTSKALRRYLRRRRDHYAAKTGGPLAGTQGPAVGRLDQRDRPAPR